MLHYDIHRHIVIAELNIPTGSLVWNELNRSSFLHDDIHRLIIIAELDLTWLGLVTLIAPFSCTAHPNRTKTSLNLPTGAPLVYTLDENLKPIKHKDAISPLQVK